MSVSITILKRESCKYYTAKFRYTNQFGQCKQKELSTGVSKYGSKKEAMEKARGMVDDFIRRNSSGKVGREDHSRDTVAQYAMHWMHEIQGSIRDNTWTSYQLIVEKHIIPLIGAIRLRDLDQYDLANFIEAELDICRDREKIVAKKKKNGEKIRNADRPFYYSIEKHVALIRNMLGYAFREDDVVENVALKINTNVLKKIPRSSFQSQPFNAQEVLTLRQAIMGSTIETPVIITSYLGLRRSEVLGLKWTDIDFAGGIIYIRNTCILVGSRTVFYDDTAKNEASIQPLPLLPELAEYLKKLKKQQKEEQRVFGSAYYECENICRIADGTPIKPNYVTQTFNRLLKKNGLRHTRFHDLRHSVGTRILEETGDIELASRVLRHSNSQTTSKLYVQPGMNYMASGLEKMNSANIKSTKNPPKTNENET